MAPEWREIPGYPGYEASEDGRVRSAERECANYAPTSRTGRRRVPAKELKPHLHAAKGRLQYTMSFDGSLVTRGAHVLVCLAFHGPRPPGQQVRHLDGDKTNNRASNLRWGTLRENKDDVIRHGVFKGERHPKAKLTAAEVAAIRAAESHKAARAAHPHISPSHVGNIRGGRAWKT